jgi:hypothetical protein
LQIRIPVSDKARGSDLSIRLVTCVIEGANTPRTPGIRAGIMVLHGDPTGPSPAGP